MDLINETNMIAGYTMGMELRFSFRASGVNPIEDNSSVQLN